jgi:hypothetical protein
MCDRIRLPFRFAVLSVLAAVVAAVTVVPACSPATNKAIIRGAVDLTLAVCVAEHPDADMPALRTICGVTADLEPVVHELTKAAQRGREGASRDAGAPLDGGR